MIELAILQNKIEELLETETCETLTRWLDEKRKETRDEAALNMDDAVVRETCSCGSNDLNWHKDLGCRECC